MCFAAVWDSHIKSQGKKYYPFPCICIFDKLLKMSYHKKYHRNKYAYINTK